jgi:TolB-like protein/DNA-binding winged helix-turn-helix (wHTH) protein/Tfp pilus assembly protein PilF
MDVKSGFTLGDWAVYPMEGRLVNDEVEERIQPKAMDVLLCLAERANKVVERDDILRQVWGERAPSDEPLTRCIGDLRRVFGDTRTEQRYIQTVPKRGYRLLLTVEPPSEIEPAAESAAPEREDAQGLTPRKSLKRISMARKFGIAVVLLIAAAFAETIIDRLIDLPATVPGKSEQPDGAPLVNVAPMQSIAVLPFVDLSEKRDQEYFSDGISEELTNMLAQTPGLRVIARSSAFTFKERREDIPAIALLLGVSHILDGSVRKSGDQLRVTVQLIDAQSNSHLYSQNYNAELHDIFEIQDSIATSVVDQLRLILLDERPRRQAVDSKAYDDYLQGRYLAELGDAASMQAAQARFENAVHIAPDFADSWVALGDTYRFRASRGQMDQKQGRQLAREAAARALDIDPEHPGAFVLQGHIARSFDWDWQVADTNFQKAVSLDPGDSDALRGAASIALTLGRLEESVELARKAVLLDPLSVSVLQNLALFQVYSGRFPEAGATVETLIARDATQPTAYAMRSWIHVLSGNAGAGVDAAHQESEEPIRYFSEAIAYFAAGDDAASEEALNELISKYGDIWYYQIALIFAYTGRADEAYDWLDKAYAARDTGLSVSLVDPFLDNIRDDARWPGLLARLNLPIPSSRNE